MNSNQPRSNKKWNLCLSCPWWKGWTYSDARVHTRLSTAHRHSYKDVRTHEYRFRKNTQTEVQMLKYIHVGRHIHRHAYGSIGTSKHT